MQSQTNKKKRKAKKRIRGNHHIFPSSGRIYTQLFSPCPSPLPPVSFPVSDSSSFRSTVKKRIGARERSHFFYLLIFIHGCLKPSSFPSGSAPPPFSLFHSLKSLVPSLLPYRRVLLRFYTPSAMYPGVDFVAFSPPPPSPPSSL